MSSKLALVEASRLVEETEPKKSDVISNLAPMQACHRLAILVKSLQIEVEGLKQRIEQLGGPFDRPT